MGKGGSRAMPTLHRRAHPEWWTRFSLRPPLRAVAIFQIRSSNGALASLGRKSYVRIPAPEITPKPVG
jgi:hypothetical protein